MTDDAAGKTSPLAEALDRLYAVAPAHFVRARKALAKLGTMYDRTNPVGHRSPAFYGDNRRA